MSLAFSIPSTKNSTSVTRPALSVAFAETVTLPLSVEPAVGDVIETMGSVTSGVPPVGKSVYSRRFGEPFPGPVTTPRVVWLTTANATCAGVAPGLV